MRIPLTGQLPSVGLLKSAALWVVLVASCAVMISAGAMLASKLKTNAAIDQLRAGKNIVIDPATASPALLDARAAFLLKRGRIEEAQPLLDQAPLRAEDDRVMPWRAMLVLSDETSIKRVDRMRADFLANASHELRTPLASLAGFIETLRGHARDDNEARERFLGIMFDQTERMQRLINDLLSLSRVEMDEHVPPSSETDLSALVEDARDYLRPQLEEKAIRLTVRKPASAPAVGDRDQLMEVLLNLIENAIKYSPEGSAVQIEVDGPLMRDEAERPQLVLGAQASRLTLAAPASEPRERYFAIRIRDEGKGIERRNLPRLSERFYRVDGQKSGPKEGTGLGLAIVKHIVNRHRGGFTVESAPGEGSVFSVFLPVPAAVREQARESV